jgi:ABC-type branched-subunit amino acid transport system substrate-binding protein
MMFFVVFVLSGGIFDILEKPLALMPRGSGWTFVYRGSLNVQTLNESVLSGILYFIGVLGFYLLLRSTRQVYNPRQAYLTLILGLMVALIAVFAFMVMAGSIASAQKAKVDFKYEDPIGVVKIKPNEPIHVACWFVVAGPDTSLGTDTKRGVEIAIVDKGGKVLGFPIKLSVQDTGCNAEGGQAAATKLAADPTIIAAIGSSCSSEARPGAPILWKAGIATVSPSATSPDLTDPTKRGREFDGFLRTAHNDKVQGAVAAEFAWKQLKSQAGSNHPRWKHLC